jgi:hypothetical protein
MAFNVGDLPAGATEALGNPLPGDTVQLPFQAPLLWWRNGSRNTQPINGVDYFGGWAVNADELHRVHFDPPPGFKMVTWKGKNERFDAYTGRYIGVAPILQRRKWVQGDDGNNRSHVQILCLAATWNGERKVFVPYGPVVLSAKAWTGKYLIDAFKEFDRVTAEIRSQYNLPASFFYTLVGTFGQEPNMVMRGKKTQSPITPPTINPTQQYSANALEVMYIGSDAVRTAIDLRDQAMDWASDWQD